MDYSPGSPRTVELQAQRALNDLHDSKRIPSIHLVDRTIHQLGGSTFALSLQPSAIQSSKKAHKLSPEQQFVEYAREGSAYRRELQFFHCAYTAAEELTLLVRSVIQEMILNYYLRPIELSDDRSWKLGGEEESGRDEEWLRLADHLQNGLDLYEKSVARAESDWIQLSSQQASRDNSAWI